MDLGDYESIEETQKVPVEITDVLVRLSVVDRPYDRSGCQPQSRNHCHEEHARKKPLRPGLLGDQELWPMNVEDVVPVQQCGAKAPTDGLDAFVARRLEQL